MSWEYVRLKEIATIIMGQSPKSEYFNSEGEGMPFMQGKTEFGEFSPSIVKYTTKTTRVAKNNSILFTVRAPVGALNIANQDICIGRGLASIDSNDGDNYFLYYLIKNHHSLFLSESGEGVYDSINKTNLNNVKLFIPSNIDLRKKIGAILGAYDDLIENNLKRIKLLEQAAQNIYKEWFVNLRFPGHENTPINQETGLPEGFDEKSLSDLVSKITDGTHDSPKPKDKGFYLVTGKNINNGFLDFSNAYLISKEDHDKVQKRSFLELGDILYSNIGTIGSTTIVDQDFKYSCKNVIIFKPLEFHSFFLYCFLTNTHTKSLFLQGLAGSSQKFISLTYARSYKEIFPSTDSIVLFHNTVKDFFKQKKLLHVQNQKLKAARDILLPRLMNRTIEV